MVVRFVSSPEDGRESGRPEREAVVEELAARRDASNAQRAPRLPRVSDAPSVAPVTYLPGAQPSDAAIAAKERLDAMAADEGTARRGSGRRNPAIDEPEASTERGTDRPKAAKRASNVSIHQLARRGMSRWELQQVLQRRGVEDELAQAELNRLESVGLLDDAALAVTLVYTQHVRHGKGRGIITQELRRRHIDPEIIEDALAEIADDDEAEKAVELAVKRVRQMSSLDDETVKRRLHGFLARKGYSGDVVRAAIAVALEER